MSKIVNNRTYDQISIYPSSILELQTKINEFVLEASITGVELDQVSIYCDEDDGINISWWRDRTPEEIKRAHDQLKAQEEAKDQRERAEFERLKAKFGG